MPHTRLHTSSHCTSTVLFTSDTMPPRTHVEWSSLSFLTSHHLLLQANYPRNQISLSPLLTSCTNQHHPHLNRPNEYCTSSLLWSVTTGNTLSVTTSAIDGSLDPLVPGWPASTHRNFLAHLTADVSDVESTGASVSMMATITDESRVMVGYESAMIRFRRSALKRWPWKVPLSSCSFTRRFYSRGRLPYVSR